MATHTAQTITGPLRKARSSFSHNLMENSKTTEIYQDVPSCMFVNMDKSTVVSNSMQLVNDCFKKGNIISIKSSRSNLRKKNVPRAVPSNGAKLPLFIISEGS